MSTPINTGGPAFPIPPDQVVSMGDYKQWVSTTSDMALRDWFAGHEGLSDWDITEAIPPCAMCTFLAGRVMPDKGWDAETDDEWRDMLRWEADWRAALRYIRADAMLRAREANNERAS